MTREERCQLAIERGVRYEPETGKVFGVKGKEIIRKTNKYINFSLRDNGIDYNLLAHQFAWYWMNKECVDYIDHINGEPSDNRICNLRIVTHQQNHFNRKTAKGYYFDKKLNKWRTQIQLNNKTIHLGLFDNEEDARQAYLDAKEKYHIIKNPHKEG